VTSLAEGEIVIFVIGVVAITITRGVVGKKEKKIVAVAVQYSSSISVVSRPHTKGYN
jgi:hypothetical protein